MSAQQAPVDFTNEIKNLFVQKKLEQARERLLNTLSQGWAGHHNLIALTYLYLENRTESDGLKALEWLEKGVLANEPDSQVVLGRLLMSGELGVQNFNRGLDLLKQAARANVLMAVLTLSQVYGKGVESLLSPDEQLAQQYIEQAASLGDPNSAYHLALEIEKADMPDYSRAFAYFDKAAQGGLPQAMHNVAVYYLHGKGVPRNAMLAQAYFTEAAKLGSPLSILSLALLYLDGADVPQNHAEALGWLYIYQSLFPESEVPAQLADLPGQASPDAIQFARAAAQNFLNLQLKKPTNATLH